MSKRTVSVLIGLASLLLIFIVINQIDTAPAEGIFTFNDLLPGEALESLESFKTKDPFSGKHFLWHESKGLLYSIDPDRSDDGGQERGSLNRSNNYDIAVRIRCHYESSVI